MLTRRREPEVMDSAQDAQEYDAMDHREVNQQFAQDLLAGGNLVGEVLDLGVGTAQIPIEICQQCSSCKILGIDLADSMLQLGRRRVVSVGMTDRVSLERQDAKQLKYPANRFDAVISNSIVHHIPRPSIACGQAGWILVLSRSDASGYKNRIESVSEAVCGQRSSTRTAAF